MKLNTTQILVLTGLAFLVFLAYRKGIFAKDRQKPLDPVTASGGQTPTRSTAQNENICNNIIAAVENNISLFFAQNTLYNALLPLTQEAGGNNADFIEVFNIYARKRANSEYKSLSSFLMSEWLLIGSPTYLLRNAIVQHAASLGL